MKKKTKQLILSIVITLVLLLTFTVTYAVFTYQQTGSNNQQLVLGDIYMHYQETNQLKMENAMPGGGLNKITTGYLVNPIIATQDETDETTELYACVQLVTQMGWSEYLDNNSTVKTYCQGTGTMEGNTIQDDLAADYYSDEKIQEMVSRNIIIEENTYYTSLEVNPIMKVEETGTGILGKCEVLFTNDPFDEGTTATTFCQGTGTGGGLTFQEILDANSSNDEFMQFVGKKLLVDKIILPKIDLPYFEFTISGKNTYSKKNIWYEVVLNHGDTPENRNTRIKDKFLKFKLTEVNEDNSETEIFSGKSYDTLENKRIHVETIPKNTMNKINKTYRLYMWIDENVVIGNVDEDYTTDEWNDVFASVKVNVSGDFFEKEVAYEDIYDVTDASCFTTEIVKSYQLNNNMTEEELAVCVDYFKDEKFEYGSTPESFCKGTGSMYWEQTFQYELDNYGYDESNLTYLEENNIVSSFDSVAISGYDETCGSDVVIPKTINGYLVTKIGLFDNKNLNSVVIPNSVRTIGGGAFEDNNLTSVVFEKNSKLTRIGEYAFKNNSLTSMLIPNSIIVIDNKAFNNNKLTSLTFEENSKVREIGDSAFRENLLINVEIPNSVTKWLHCNAFDNDVQIIKNENLSCFVEPQ